MKKLLTLIVSLLLIVTMAFMAACTPKDVESAKKKMKEADYTVIGYESKDAENLVGAFAATNPLAPLTDTLVALLFEDKESAKDFAEKTGENAVQDGKWVYWGAEDAIKAFTK